MRAIAQTRVSHHSEPARPQALSGTEAGAWGGGRSWLEAGVPWAGTGRARGRGGCPAPSSRAARWARGPPGPSPGGRSRLCPSLGSASGPRSLLPAALLPGRRVARAWTHVRVRGLQLARGPPGSPGEARPLSREAQRSPGSFQASPRRWRCKPRGERQRTVSESPSTWFRVRRLFPEGARDPSSLLRALWAEALPDPEHREIGCWVRTLGRGVISFTVTSCSQVPDLEPHT